MHGARSPEMADIDGIRQQQCEGLALARNTLNARNSNAVMRILRRGTLVNLFLPY